MCTLLKSSQLLLYRGKNLCFRPDAVIDPWLESFWKITLQLFPLPAGKSIISTDIW